MTRELSPEERQTRALEARQFTQSSLFRAMFDGVSDALESRAISCNPADKDLAADIIRCKQLLVAMRREIERRAEDADFAAFEITELQRRSKVREFTRNIWRN